VKYKSVLAGADATRRGDLDGRGVLSERAISSCQGMADRTARGLLQQLKEEGLLSETLSRSNLTWEIPEHAEPWYFPELAPGVG
jgi:hypothetical protein